MTVDEGRIDLDPEGGAVSVPTEIGTGGPDDEGIELSTIVERINDALGTEFTPADQPFLNQLREDALCDEHLRRSARVNSDENFALEFDGALTDLFIDRMDQNRDLFATFMDDENVQNLITGICGARCTRRARGERPDYVTTSTDFLSTSRETHERHVLTVEWIRDEGRESLFDT